MAESARWRCCRIAILLGCGLQGCSEGPAELAAHLQEARGHLSRRHYPAALAAFDRVLAIDARHSEARRLKAEIFYNTARHAEAEALLVELRKDNPRDLDVVWGLAMVRKDQRRFDEALTLFSAMPVADQPPVPMAETLTGLGRHDEAARWIGRHLAGDPFDSKAYYLLAQIEYRRGREAQGRFWGEVFRRQEPQRRDDSSARSLEFAGQPLQAALLRGRSMVQRGRLFAGLQSLTRVVQADNRVVPAYLLIGEIMVAIGNSVDAVQAFEHVLRLESGNRQAPALLAQAKARVAADAGRRPTPVAAAKRFAALGQADRARAAALFAARSDPKDLVALRLVGQLFDRPEDAFVRLWAWQQAAALAPQDAALTVAQQAEWRRLGIRQD